MRSYCSKIHSTANAFLPSIAQIVLCTASLLGGTVPSISIGQTTTLEEVLVTATRREVSSQDVAASISVVGAEDLANKGITEFEDLNRIAAGLHLEALQGGSSASVRVRGVGSAGFSSVDPSVGVIIDGIYQPRLGTVFTEMMDVERIEVLRGPQGTLFGKNTTAGAIMLHTTKPDTNEFSGKVQTVAGNLGNAELRGTINIPIVEESLALRLSGFTAKRDGFNDNVLLGVDTRDIDRRGGRAKILFEPTEKLQALYSYEQSENNYRADQGLVRYGSLDSSRAGALSGAPLSEVAAALGTTLPSIGKFTRRVHQSEQFAVDDLKRQILNLKWDLGPVTLTSITGKEEFETYLPADNDGSPLDLVRITSNPLSETFTQELQLASNGEGLVDYVVGLWYQDEDVLSPTTSADGADAAALEGRPQRPATQINSTLRNETKAAFANVTFHASDRMDIGLGLRRTEADKYSNQTISVFPVIAGLNRTFDEWTYTGNISYKLENGNLVYFNYGRGFKAGGFNRQETLCFIVGASFCLPDSRLVYDPETTDSFEVGIKSEWMDRRLRLNAALYFQSYDDFQVTSKFPPTSTIVQNAADVDSRGVELEFTYLANDKFTFDGSVAHNVSEYGSFTNAPCSLIVSKSPTCSQDLSGRQLDNAPKWTVNLGGEYRDVTDMLSGSELFIRLDSATRSETNLAATLATDTIQDNYTLLGFRAGLESISGPWKVSVWANNLGDEDYAVLAGRPSGHTDGLTMVQGLPRTYGITLDWSF